MSKRDRELKQRLEELFSESSAATPPEAAAPEPATTPEPLVAPASASATPPETLAETALPASFDLWKTILDHLPLPLYIKDHDHNWVAANVAFGELIGHPVGTLIGHADTEQPDEAWQQDDQVLETAQADDTQQSTPLPDGSIQTRRVRRIPLNITDGHAQYVLGIVESIVKPPAVPENIPPASDIAAEFKTAFDHTIVGMALLTTDGRFMHANQAWCDILGYSEQELRTLRFRDLTHPEDVEESLGYLRKMLSGAIDSFKTEKRYLHHQGHVVWVELFSVLMRDANRQPLYFISQIQTIDERKQLEERWHKSEALLQSVTDVLPYSLCRKDLAGHFTFGNQTFCRNAGLSLNELIGKTDFDIHPAELAEKYRQDDQRVIESGRPAEFIEAHSFKDEPVHYVQTIKTPVRDSQGQITGLQIMFWDVTERQTVEEDLKLRTSALESAANGIAITDKDGRILWINRAFTQLTGYTLEEATGQNPRVLKSGKMPPEFYHKMWQTISSGQVWQDELINRRKDGSEYFEEMTITPVRTTGNEITHYIAVKQDITARKRSEEQLLRFKLGLERSIDAVFMTDLQGVIQYINPAFEHIYQYTAAEALGQTPRILKSGVIPAEQYAAFWQALLSKNVVAGQIINRRKDGQLLTIEGSNNPIVDEAGNLLGFLAVHRDVSDREHAQEQLRLLTAAVENMATGVMIADQTGTIQWTNPAFTAITGYEPAEALGQTPRLLKSGKQSAEFYREMWRTITSGSAWHGELINRRKDGAEYNEELIITPLRAQGQDITHYIAVLQNITGRKTTEAEREHLIQQEARRVAQLQTAAEITSTAASMLNVSDLPPVIVELIRERFDLYYTGLFLSDNAQKWAVLQAGTGEAGRKMLDAGHRLEIGGQSMIGRCLSTGEARIALDVGKEAVRFNNPLLPRTRSELALPLTGHGRVIGALTIQSDRIAAFSPGDIATLQTMANQIAATIENARLLQEAQRRAAEQTVLFKLAQALSAKLTIEQVLREIYSGASQLIDTANFSIGLYDASRREIDFVLRASGSEVDQSISTRPADRGLAGYVIRTRRSLLLNENIETWLSEHGLAHEGESAQAWLGVPMLLGDQISGAMVVQNYQRTNAYTEHDRDLLQVFSAQAAIAIQNAQLFEEAQRRLRETQILQQFGQTISETLNDEAVLDALVQTLDQQLRFSHIGVSLIDEAAGVLRTLRTRGATSGLQDAVRSLESLRDDIMLDVARKGQTEVVDGWDDRFDRAIYEQQGHAALVRAFVPIRVRGRSVGLIEAGYVRTQRPRITPDEVRILDSLADYTAVALENVRLFQQARTQADQQAALNELSQALTAQLNVDQVLTEVYQGVSRLMDTTNFYIGLYNAERNEVSFPINVTDSVIDKQIVSMPADQGITGYVLRTKSSLLIADNLTEWRLKTGVELIGEDARSWLGAPLMIGEQVLGIMGVQSYTTARRYDEHDRNMLTAIANQAAVALQNAQLFEEAQRRLAELQTLNTLSQTLASQMDVDTLLKEVGGHILSALKVNSGFIALYDEQTHIIRFPFYLDEGAPIIGEARPLGQGLTSRVIEQRQPLMLRQITPEILEQMGGLRRGSGGTLQQSWLGVPILLGEQCLGVVNVQAYPANYFDEGSQRLLTTIAANIATTLQKAQLFEQVQRDAERERTINRVTTRIRNAQSVEQVLQIAAQELRTAAHAAASVIEIAPAENRPTDHAPNGHGQNGRE